MAILINIFRLFMQFIYDCMKCLPQQNKITMISRQSDDINTDFYLLQEELKSEFKVVVLCKTLNGGKNAKIYCKIKYFFHMFKQMYHMATSKIVILDTYCILISLLKHKKSLKVIQIWHSIGTMKKFGYSILNLKEGTSKSLAIAMRMHKNYDFVFCSSYAYRSHLAAGFNCKENIIKEFPLPRIDLLKNDSYQKELKNKIFTTYPELKNEKNIIYCPTFRKGNDRSVEHIKQLLEYLPSHYNLIVKLHPLSKIKIENDNLFICEEFSTSELFSIADVIISDYSCVIYEAAIMDIPIYLYAYDLSEYEVSRGLAIDYIKEMPGPICSSAKELMNLIAENDYDFKKLKKFTQKYVKSTNSATKDIVKFIKEIVR